MSSRPSSTQMRLYFSIFISTYGIFLLSMMRLETSEVLIGGERAGDGARGVQGLVQPTLGSGVSAPSQRNASIPDVRSPTPPGFKFSEDLVQGMVQPTLGSGVSAPSQLNASIPDVRSPTPPAIKFSEDLNSSDFPVPSRRSEEAPLAAFFKETGPVTTPAPVQATAMNGEGFRATGQGALAQVESQNTSTGDASAPAVSPPTNSARTLPRAPTAVRVADRPAAGAACEPHHDEDEGFFEVCSQQSVFAAHLRVEGDTLQLVRFEATDRRGVYRARYEVCDPVRLLPATSHLK